MGNVKIEKHWRKVAFKISEITVTHNETEDYEATYYSIGQTNK